MRCGAVAALAMLAGCVSGPTPPPQVSTIATRPTPVPLASPPTRGRPGPTPAFRTAPPGLKAQIAALVAAFGGRIGVAIRGIDEGWTVDAHGTLRLPQQSVSKLWVAMTVFAARDAGKLTLTDPVTVRPEDLTLFHQPIAALVRSDGFDTNVMDLLTRAMTQSDNTANDRLLTLVGGPAAVRALIAAKNLGDIRFGPGERLLQSQTAGIAWVQAYSIDNGFERARGRLAPAARLAAFERYIADPPDGATPIAIVAALARLARGELLSETSTRVLLGLMSESVTGKQRMRGAIPPGWQFAHKTGTGQNIGGRTAGYNDVGLLTAPDGRRFAIAILMGDTSRTIAERQALMQAVVTAVVAVAAR